MPEQPDPPARSVPPPKRKYGERPRHALRDIDAADRAIRLQALAWSAAVAALVFGLSGIMVAYGMRPPTLYLVWLGGVLAGIAVYHLALRVTGGGARIMGKIHNPSGSSTPAVREYSHAQSLAKRGRYQEAVDAYTAAAAEFPEDPEPYIRVARICRDHLQQYEEAAAWFKRARTAATIDTGREMLVTQEIIELYRKRMEAPERAIPELARMLDRFPDHPQADAARAELQALRDMIRARDDQ